MVGYAYRRVVDMAVKADVVFCDGDLPDRHRWDQLSMMREGHCGTC